METSQTQIKTHITTRICHLGEKKKQTTISTNIYLLKHTRSLQQFQTSLQQQREKKVIEVVTAIFFSKPATYNTSNGKVKNNNALVVAIRTLYTQIKRIKLFTNSNSEIISIPD